ncbi:MAG: SsrA-binding protein SmpB [Candidatus Paceibacterota bacterium]
MKLLSHKKAHLNYEILEKMEAGIELSGFEVKTLRAKHGSLNGSYITIGNKEAFLVNAYIPPYQPANAPDDHDPYRPRKLLLSKKEIDLLIGKEKEKSLTVIPLSLYTKGKLIKAEIAVARGKKKKDKREDIKKKDVQRDINRELKARLK